MAGKQTTDVRELNKLLKKASTEVKNGFAAALVQEGFRILATATVECPVDKGFLQNTGRLAMPSSLEQPRVLIYYGMEYALPVHERHNDWLKRSLDEHQPGIAGRLKRRTLDNARQGVALSAFAGASAGPKA